MRSGRGTRLPGMGAPTAPASPPPAPETDEPPVNTHTGPEVERAPAQAAPKQRRSHRATQHSSARQARGNERHERDDRAQATTSSSWALPAHAPHAGEAKIQVNPRIYRGIWHHYEQLVDELPRERRRGALTALINAVLAQHAPRDIDEARNAIAWLRRAEARDAPTDTGDRKQRV